MLVLSRKLQHGQDSVVVTMPDGSRMRILILEMDRGKIRLGFDAPKSFQIMREELLPDEARPSLAFDPPGQSDWQDARPLASGDQARSEPQVRKEES